jgi:tRNA(Ile)-lysidine synthase
MADPAELIIEAPDCDRLFAGLAPYQHLLVAVSGGVDSTCLLFLLDRWCKQQVDRPELSVAVVDHGLRAGSVDEARFVCEFAEDLGRAAAILLWQGDKPQHGVQEAAREARYRLLMDHAGLIKADALVLAHHADDQGETVLMRLCAGSGLDGLAGMRNKSHREGLDLLRPLLSVSKQQVVATATHHGLKWFEDPSNQQDRFTRVRFRHMQGLLDAAGLDRARLNRLAMRMARAQAALDQMVEVLWGQLVQAEGAGLQLRRGFFEAAPELQIRLLVKACRHLASDRPHRLERFEQAQERLAHAYQTGHDLKLTLAGCVMHLEAELIHIHGEGVRKRGRKALKSG